ncbi:putative hydro-lyase [Helianthus anomalus]
MSRDKAVFSADNSLGGNIHQNYYLLLHYMLHVYGEVQHSVRSELQVLSFIFRPLCKFCPLCLKLTSFVLYV